MGSSKKKDATTEDDVDADDVELEDFDDEPVPVPCEVDDDCSIIEQPPRVTSKAKLPDACVLKRSTFNRARLFVPDAISYEELRCSSSVTQHVDRTSRFHSLTRLNERTAKDYDSTTLCCWHDGHPFDGHVCVAPQAFDPRDGTYQVTGCFCSMACSKAWILSQGGVGISAQLVLHERLSYELYGVRNVVAAPPRLALDIYGGPYSLARFRAVSYQSRTRLVTPPFVSNVMVAEERDTEGSSVSALGVNGISSVTGLRRPRNPVQLHTAELDVVPAPYTEFLAARGVATEADPTTDPATHKAARRPAAGTLGRYMKQ